MDIIRVPVAFDQHQHSCLEPALGCYEQRSAPELARRLVQLHTWAQHQQPLQCVEVPVHHREVEQRVVVPFSAEHTRVKCEPVQDGVFDFGQVASMLVRLE